MTEPHLTAEPSSPIGFIESGLDPDEGRDDGQIDPALLVLTCANCGATMDERKCKLVCACGYFASCSDYY